MKTKTFTNCFLVKTNPDGVPIQICLAMKKRGFGEGMWNGAGGKPEDGESIEDAAHREIEEEFGVSVADIDKRAEIEFILLKENMAITMHTYLVVHWTGDPVETEEMKPQWFDIETVPYESMWKSDGEWLPLILKGKKIRAKYTYEQEGGDVQQREVTEIEEF